MDGVFKKTTWIIWIYVFAGILPMHSVIAKIGYFWHITDLHLDSFYSTNGNVLRGCKRYEHHQSKPTRFPGRYGDYQCDSPWSLLESAANAMKSRQGDNVEFVLWTGDGLAHSAMHLTETQRLDLLQNITDMLSHTFPSQFVFPVLGHDDIINGVGNYTKHGELWRQWLPLEALQTFTRGGYYTIEQTKSRLRIIVLNTNYMRHDHKYTPSHSAAIRHRGDFGESNEYNNNFHYRYNNQHHYYGHNGHNSHHTLDGNGGTVSALSSGDSSEGERQWNWFEDVLRKSKQNKETVYIVGHMPPGFDERQMGGLPNTHSTFSEKNNLKYLKLVRDYSSIIQGQFFGHLHSDTFRIIYDNLGTPVSWIMIAPSVTPRKLNNPAMRLYKFDADTGQVLDYTQFYLDLEQANTNGEAIWQAEYNLTTHYYGLSEVTAVALHNLADRFTNTENPLFAKYYRANSVRYDAGQCEGVCALNHYCAITRVDFRDFRKCLETAASALQSNSTGRTIQNQSIPLMLISLFLTIVVHHRKYFQILFMVNSERYKCRSIISSPITMLSSSSSLGAVLTEYLLVAPKSFLFLKCFLYQWILHITDDGVTSVNSFFKLLPLSWPLYIRWYRHLLVNGIYGIQRICSICFNILVMLYHLSTNLTINYINYKLLHCNIIQFVYILIDKLIQYLNECQNIYNHLAMDRFNKCYLNSMLKSMWLSTWKRVDA